MKMFTFQISAVLFASSTIQSAINVAPDEFFVFQNVVDIDILESGTSLGRDDSD